MSSSAQASPFTLRTVVLMVAAGFLAAAAFVVLLAWAPDLRNGHDGGAHPLSVAGTGYRGIVELLDAAGTETAMVRDDRGLIRAGLLIVTLAPGSDPEALKHIVSLRKFKPTLYILPKWAVIPLAGHSGWVRRLGSDSQIAQDILTVLAPLRVEYSEPAAPKSAKKRPPPPAVGDIHQWLSGGPMTPLLSQNGHVVLASTGDGQMFILAEPDLIANHGLKNPQTAKLAVEMIERLRPNDQPVAFDLTLHGFASSRSLLKTLLVPPFLALTLSILGAGLLAGLHAFGRFGPARDEPRALPFGKAALIDNAAGLIRRANRGGRMGEAYVALTRDAASAAIHAPSLPEPELEALLDRTGAADLPRFTQLAGAARGANTPTAVADAARALYNWRRSLGA
jgi:hypothetical protein